MYLLNPFAIRSNFKRSIAGLNSKFSFSSTGCCTRSNVNSEKFKTPHILFVHGRGEAEKRLIAAILNIFIAKGNADSSRFELGSFSSFSTRIIVVLFLQNSVNDLKNSIIYFEFFVEIFVVILCS